MMVVYIFSNLIGQKAFDHFVKVEGFLLKWRLAAVGGCGYAGFLFRLKRCKRFFNSIERIFCIPLITDDLCHRCLQLIYGFVRRGFEEVEEFFFHFGVGGLLAEFLFDAVEDVEGYV
ncbi:hypothetical protein, putative [Babesia ovata]|uniref:Uncharacterized protein n=1 Tax=Babesia ovata TaxID=189622 RepID=A0A2H6KIX0_9APIC|nr:hypothetical protein, putative [Babesia ovata]GBE62938.1 hypothetical protein, putative [Babesia ovata]